MSQFERDMHLAIQQSLEEERKKQEGATGEQNNQNTANTANVENNVAQTPGKVEDSK